MVAALTSITSTLHIRSESLIPAAVLLVVVEERAGQR